MEPLPPALIEQLEQALAEANKVKFNTLPSVVQM
jgi:hypothetical protein